MEIETAAMNEQVSMNVEAFDLMLEAQGAEFVHWRALRCPRGLTGLYDNRRAHDDHSGCSNGFIYKKVGKVHCSFTGSGDKKNKKPEGLVDSSTGMITVERLYSGTDIHVQLANFDRLYLSEEAVTVVNWELFEANQSGLDKMRFPVETIEHIVDAEGREYGEHDFAIKDGKIAWGKKRPGVQTDGAGTICTARYTYRPYWYISRLIHESRFIKVPDDMTGGRKIVRMPYQCEIQREYFFENEQNDDKTPVSARQQRAPQSGSFGPR